LKQKVSPVVKLSWIAFPALLFFAGCSENAPITKTSQGYDLTSQQWYLNNTGQNSGSDSNATPGEDLNMGNVWESYRGNGIRLAIIDTGVDAIHYDLTRNLSMTLSGYYYNGTFKQDRERLLTDNQMNTHKGFEAAHGTACAGVAAATDNGIGVTGVAPMATLVSLNAFADDSDYGSLSFEHALYHTGMEVDISSNSWNDTIVNGPDDSSLELQAIKSGATYGRNGKGIVYLFAAGNEREVIPESSNNANWLRELNNPYVITVAALNADGNYSSYSNFGANILISAFGGEYGLHAPAIVTTDLIGDYGYDSQEPAYFTSGKYQVHFNVAGNEEGDFTHVMNGTSAATPMAAGVVALLLEANPDLTYNDVRYILATTARKNNPTDGDWTQNGAGHWVNHNYGFGAIDVEAAVTKAASFTSLYATPQKNFSVTKGSLVAIENSLNIATENNASLFKKVGSITVSDADSLILDHVDLTIDLVHAYPGDLDIILESPDETNATLTHHGSHPIDADSDFFAPFTFGSVRYLDENSSGTWNIYIRDYYFNDSNEKPDEGLYDGYQLTLYGR
jgi:kexin